MLQPNKFTQDFNANIDLYGQPNNLDDTLGVAEELKRFATNEFFKTRNEQVLVGVDSNIVEDDLPQDDLLLTNAITEDNQQDQIDKTRYMKEVKTYVEVNSASRLATAPLPAVKTDDKQPSLIYTGEIPVSTYVFAPFDVLGTDFNQNVANRYSVVNQVVSDGTQNKTIGKTLDFTAQTPPTDLSQNTVPVDLGYMQTPNSVIITSQINFLNFTFVDNTQNIIYVDTQSNELFSLFIPVGGYSPFQLQQLIQNTLDSQIKNGFKVEVFISSMINPGKLNIKITALDPSKQYDTNKNLINPADTPNFTAFTMRWLVQSNQPTPAPPAMTIDGTLVTPVVAPEGVPLSIEATQGSITFFPNPNNYVLTLNRAITNVKAIRLVSSEIPNTDTIINQFNCKVTFKIVDNNGFGLNPKTPFDPKQPDLWVYFIPIGNYTVQQLVAKLQTDINNLLTTGISPEYPFPIPPEGIFTFNFDPITGIFSIITPSASYSFIWTFDNNSKLGWRNLWNMLGFNKFTNTDNQGNYYSLFDNTTQININTPQLPQYASVAYGAINLRVSNNIWLNINGYENVFDSYTQQSFFAKFSTKNKQANQLITDSFTSAPIIFDDAPIPSVSQLAISFFDETGMPYNFNNVNHSFCLEFISYLDRFKGADYSAKRGTNDNTSYNFYN